MQAMAAGLGCVAARGAAAQARMPSSPRSPGDLDAFLAEQADHFGIPGMAVTVVDGAQDVHFGVGRASLTYDVPVDSQTLFHIGSNGKRFTAVALLQLVEQGLLKLSDSLLKHVPDAPGAWGDRTLMHLLHHTSGLPDYLQGFDWTKPHSRQQVLQSAQASPPKFPAGAGWSYSNTNYMLLGYAIEKASGVSYRDYLTAQVLERAGMKRSRVDASAEIIPGRAEGYERSTISLSHAPLMDNAASGWPDGGVLVCAADWGPWQRALLNGSLIGADSLKTLRTPATLTTSRQVPYGGALFIESLSGSPYFWHTGGVPGFTSFTLEVPRRELSVLIATNADLGSSRAQRYLGQRVAEAFAPGSTALSLAPVHDDDPRLTQRVQDMLLRGDGDVDLSILAPEVLQESDPAGHAVPIPSMAQNPQNVAVVEVKKTREATFRRYRFTYADRIEHVSIGFTPASLIFWAFWL